MPRPKQAMSSCVGCLPAPDDYSKLLCVWFLTSECRGNAEGTRTTLLGTFRTSYTYHRELVKIPLPQHPSPELSEQVRFNTKHVPRKEPGLIELVPYRNNETKPVQPSHLGLT
ncbi:hypothetical protein PIB30_095494 [Stylosanthes scabra]|uniref:Uncharacterized protein n=1 Tax=Stylosanthes scabra TaxID=79078 RepID=A0ABU6SW98_9FABA|nr:hypothetical protein [Stylosanthes scabra]